MLSENVLKILFTEARSHNGWQNKLINHKQIRQIYHLMKFCPTAANSCPLRMTFLESSSAKARLKPHLDGGNVNKSMTAPMVVIMAYDSEFYQKLPQLFPHNSDAINWFVGNPEKIKSTAHLNATLQIGYFILATRSVGLDCGPMSGFDNQGVDKEFFKDGKQKSLVLCAIGYGDHSKLFARSPRLTFKQACQII